MTAHPIDRDRLRTGAESAIECGVFDEDVISAVRVLLDALAAAEHRATRAEAQSEARRINAEYWKARVKAVEDVLDRWQVDGRDQLIPGESIRRALEG